MESSNQNEHSLSPDPERVRLISQIYSGRFQAAVHACGQTHRHRTSQNPLRTYWHVWVLFAAREVTVHLETTRASPNEVSAKESFKQTGTGKEQHNRLFQMCFSLLSAGFGKSLNCEPVPLVVAFDLIG